MNIILFSRKQVNHRPEQLQTMLTKIESMGMNYVVNEDFANDIENILGITKIVLYINIQLLPPTT